MSTGDSDRRMFVSCRCGNAKLELDGKPIMHVACYCDDCQLAGRQIEQLNNAETVLDANGGTAFVLFRRDKVLLAHDAALFKSYKLNAASPTSRIVATCCASVMYLDFEHGHWLSIYRQRLAVDTVPLERRVQTKFKLGGALSNEVPNHRGYPVVFCMKLLVSWMQMLLARPQRKAK